MLRQPLFIGLPVILVTLRLAGAEDAKTRVFSERMVEPQVAVSPEGGVYVVAAHEGVIAVASSADGTSFGESVRVAKLEGMALGMRSGPRIAATSRSVVVGGYGDPRWAR